MADMTMALTRKGWETLIRHGLNPDTLKYYSLSDQKNLYNITATNDIIPNITGSHFQITNTFCGYAKYRGMYPTKPNHTETINDISRLIYFFNKTDCDDQFSQPNLVLRVNINDWLESFSGISYSYNMTETLSQILWNYVSVTIQKLDLPTNNYVDVNSLTNINLSYTPNTESDYINYIKLNPKLVRVNDNNTKKLTYTPTKFASPFLFPLTTENINGTYVPGTQGSINLVPDRWGYLIGEVGQGNFQSIANVENNVDPNSNFSSITPAVQIGNSYYYATSNTSWNTQNGLIGWMHKMVHYLDPNKTALDALIQQAILFFQSEGQLINGSYIIPITFNVMATEPSINNINNIVGNKVTIEFSYTPNLITGQIIQNITNP